MSPAVEARIPNHWSPGEALLFFITRSFSIYFTPSLCIQVKWFRYGIYFSQLSECRDEQLGLGWPMAPWHQGSGAVPWRFCWPALEGLKVCSSSSRHPHTITFKRKKRWVKGLLTCLSVSLLKRKVSSRSSQETSLYPSVAGIGHIAMPELQGRPGLLMGGCIHLLGLP